MKRLLLLLLSVLCCCCIYAQRTAVVTATATYEAPLNMSPIEAEYEAVRHAQINAIAREFGTIVTSESHNYMRENSNTSSDAFFSYGEMACVASGLKPSATRYGSPHVARAEWLFTM